MRDEHSHILWDVDDGARSREESMSMLIAARDAQITHITCTPHLRWKSFDAKTILYRFNILKDAAKQLNIKMDLGFEVFFPLLLDTGLENAKDFTRANTNELLVEFNTGEACSVGWELNFGRLQSEYGLDITVAHPERYTTVINDFETVYKMKDMGCRIQVSASDLFLGRRNKMTKCAKRILSEGLCDALVSDAHCVEDYFDYEQAIKKYGADVQEY